MIFGTKKKSIILTNVFLAIATNIPQCLKTAFVLQGHNILCVPSLPNVGHSLGTVQFTFISFENIIAKPSRNL